MQAAKPYCCLEALLQGLGTDQRRGTDVEEYRHALAQSDLLDGRQRGTVQLDGAQHVAHDALAVLAFDAREVLEGLQSTRHHCSS